MWFLTLGGGKNIEPCRMCFKQKERQWKKQQVASELISRLVQGEGEKVQPPAHIKELDRKKTEGLLCLQLCSVDTRLN